MQNLILHMDLKKQKNSKTYCLVKIYNYMHAKIDKRYKILIIEIDILKK